ncbi:MAG: hypothetical protein V4621_00520 [Pseudomonadota bacterium]
MSKPGYHETRLSMIFQHVSGLNDIQIDRKMANGQLMMDFKAAAVVTDANGTRLEARFIGPDGKQINMGVADVGRLHGYTHAAAEEARRDYAVERNEYVRDRYEYTAMQQNAHADGTVTAAERQALAEKRGEMTASYKDAQDARAEYAGFARQDNEVKAALDGMREAGQAHNARVDIKNALAPGGGLA